MYVLKGVDIYFENLNSKKKFGVDDKNEVKNKLVVLKNLLYFDFEKRDFNGNFFKINVKVSSFFDLENVILKFFLEGEKELIFFDSLKFSIFFILEEK